MPNNNRNDTWSQNLEAIGRQAMLDFETGQRLRAMREAGDEVPEEEINRHMTMQGAYRMAQRLTEADSTKVERQARPFSFLNWLKSWW